MEGKEEFIDAGGESYHYVPCLNDDDSWAKLISTGLKNELFSFKNNSLNSCSFLVCWTFLCGKDVYILQRSCFI